MRIKPCLFALTVLFPLGVIAQNVYSNKPIVDLLTEFEVTTDYTFNYDKALLQSYVFTGTLQGESVENKLKKLFYQTPFEIEQQGQTILIVPAAKKPYRICGVLYDQFTNEPLPAANIYCSAIDNGIQTDINGNFQWEIEGFPNQEIIISYVGYKSKTFLIRDFEESCIDIYLSFDRDIFNTEVVVRDYIIGGITEGESYSGVTLQSKLISEQLINVENDILKSVQWIPGITALDESASNLQIRGSSPDQNLMVWEGVQLYAPGHFFGMIGAINPFVIDQVDVYKGVFSPSYDDRLGGVVDMSLSDSISSKINVGLGTTLTEAHAFVDMPIVKDKVSITTSYRNSIHELYQSNTIDNYAAKIFQATRIREERDEGDLSTEELNFNDWNGKIVIKPSARTNIIASYFSTDQKFDYDFIASFEDFATSDFIQSGSSALSLRVNHTFSEIWSAEFSYGRSKFDAQNEHFVDLGYVDATEYFFQSNRIDDRVFKWENRIKTDIGLFSLGNSFNRKEVDYNLFADFTREEGYAEDEQEDAHFQNVFGSWQFNRRKLQLNVGARYTYYVEQQTWNFSPRFNAQYAINPSIKFRLSAGLLNQYVSQLLDFADGTTGANNQVWALNVENENGVQRARKVAIGMLLRYKGWTFDLEGYVHKIIGLNSFSPVFMLQNNQQEFTTGDANYTGLDLLLNKNWRSYSFWINYTWSRSRFDFNELTNTTFPGTNNIPHNLNFIQNFKWNNWRLSMIYQYRSGLPFSRPEEEYTETIWEDDVYFNLEYQNINTERLDDYKRLDLSLQYKHSFGSVQMEFGLSIINALNTVNQFATSFNIAEYYDEESDEDILFTNETLKFGLARTPQLLIRAYW